MNMGNRVSVYYAGFDNKSLPFTEGTALAKARADSQVVYLKALALVADRVIVPPSTYFSWVAFNQNRRDIEELNDLHESGIVVATVHDGMSCSPDYLGFKESKGPFDERAFIREESVALLDLFAHIPLARRDAAIESRDFQQELIREFYAQQITNDAQESLMIDLERGRLDPGLTHRDTVLALLRHYHSSRRLPVREYRKYYYAANKAYYVTGALHHEAYIAMPGAERYSAFGRVGRDLFTGPGYHILIGYDPCVLLRLLGLLGISESCIRSLSANDLLELRRTQTFTEFKHRYLEFVLELQNLDHAFRRISRSSLAALRDKIEEEFLRHYRNEIKAGASIKGKYALSEMLFISAALGTLGFVIVPWAGALLGLLEPAWILVGGTERVGDLVRQRLRAKRDQFSLFVRELKRLSSVSSQFAEG